MKTSSIACPECGKPLVDISGLGQKEPKLICNDRARPGKHIKVLCPKCRSNNKTIITIGLGNFQYACNDCGNKWSNF